MKGGTNFFIRKSILIPKTRWLLGAGGPIPFAFGPSPEQEILIGVATQGFSRM